MSTDHRKPVVAFIVLAFLAAAVVGMQRAEAHSARFFASVLGTSGHVAGTFPDAKAASARQDEAGLQEVAWLTPPEAGELEPADLAASSAAPDRHGREHDNGTVVAKNSRGETRTDLRGRAARLARAARHTLRGPSDTHPGAAGRLLRAAAARHRAHAVHAAHRSLAKARHGHRYGSSTDVAKARLLQLDRPPG